jgi:nicotinamide-nucleotide amidase
MRIGLINIGDELLLGKILNTNARDLAGWIAELGHELAFNLTIGDHADAISHTLRSVVSESGVLPRCGMLILTGGLGPTRDDITREAVAEFLGQPLEFSREAEAWLAERLGVSADKINEGQRQQLHIPGGSIPLRNTAGTACGFRVEKNGINIFAFPGVPYEFRTMFDEHCRPLLLRRDAVLLHKRVVTFGLSESRQRECLKGFVTPEPFRFSSLPSEPGVTISLEAFVDSAEAEAMQTRLDQAWEEMLERFPAECIVERNGASLTETVFRLLKNSNRTVSVAESCTSGALGYLLTEIPGSSSVFRQGFLTYSYEAKNGLLNVPQELLEQHGAVSEPVALAMVRGCLKNSNTDYAVAITGIAGPDGGSEEKPVGLVYIAVASQKSVEVQKFVFRGDRKTNRWQSAYSALNRLRLLILKEL